MGIEFEYHNDEIKDFLNAVFTEMPELTWNVEESENNDSKTFIPLDTPLNSNKFKDALSKIDQIIFANYRGYSKSIDDTKIVTYDDYLKSDCEIIILITDGSICEIYCKDNNNLNKIVEILMKIKIKFEYKTRETDVRYKMSVN